MNFRSFLYKNIFLYLFSLIVFKTYGQNLPRHGIDTIKTDYAIIYDDGGINNYSDDADGAIVIYPKQADKYISLKFLELTIDTNGDEILIYNGNSSSAPQLTYNSSDGTYYSTASDGSLTIQLKSGKYSKPKQGFKALIKSIDKSEVWKPDIKIRFNSTSEIIRINEESTLSLSLLSPLSRKIKANILTGFYISQDKQLDSSDIFIGEKLRTEYLWFNVGILIPDSIDITPGPYYLIASTDHSSIFEESNENNNTDYIPIDIIERANPKLIFNRIFTDSLVMSNDDKFYIKYSISNIGNIGSVFVKYYLSEDTLFDSDTDIYFYNDYFSTLNQHSAILVNKYLDIPANLIHTNYTLFMLLNQNIDTDEYHDTIKIPIKVVSPSVDLIVDTFIVSKDTFKLGEPILSRTILKNTGRTIANIKNDYIKYLIYLSKDSLLNPYSDFCLEKELISTITPNEDKQFDYINKFPNLDSFGNYYLIAVVDPLSKLPEESKLNNQKIKKIYISNDSVSYSDKVDLTHYSVSLVNNTIDIIEGINLTGYILNLGCPYNGEFKYSAYISNDSLYDSTDVLMMDDYYKGYFDYGKYISFNFKTYPLNIDTGNYYIIFYIDKESNINNELNKKNNFLAIPFRIDESISISNMPDVGVSMNVDDYYDPKKTFNMGYHFSHSTKIFFEAELTYYLSNDKLIDSTDILLFTKNVISPQPKKIDGTISWGKSSMGFNINDYGKSGLNYILMNFKINNVSRIISKMVNLTPRNVDIAFDSIYTFTKKISKNELTDLSFSTHNLGTDLLYDAIEVKYYVSEDSIFDKYEDKMIGGRTFYESIDKIITPNLKFGQDTGSYYLFIIINTQSLTYDCDMTNNILKLPFQIVESSFDIQAAEFIIPDSIIYLHFDNTLHVKLTNKGNTSLQNVEHDLFLSTDSVLDINDVKLNKNIISKIDAFSYNYHFTSFKLIDTSLLGDYFLLAIADPNNDVNEFDENNNIIYNKIYIKKPDIDLSLSNLILTDEIEINHDFNFSYTIENKGRDESVSSNIAYFLSNDNNLDEDDFFITSSNIKSIKGYSSSVITDSINISVKLGTYYLIIVTDYTNNNYETNESNNIFSKPVKVATYDYDISIEYSQLTKYTGSENLYLLNTKIGNIGNLRLSKLPVSIYFSEDTLIDSKDILIDKDEYSTNGLEYVMAYQQLNISSLLLFNECYLIISADNDDEIIETDENNNIFIITLKSKQNNDNTDNNNDDDSAFTSIPEKNINHISIFPNPSSNYINISSDKANINFIELYSLDGKAIYKQLIYDSFTRINISNIEPGYYILKIFTKDSFIREEILKLH